MSKTTKGILAAIVAVVVIAGVYSLYGKKSGPYSTSTSPTPAISYNCEKGKTAYELLAAKHTLTTKDTSFGKQIEGIDGVTHGDKNYWAFYIDNKLAPVGAEAYNCTGTEKIDWKLDSF